MHTDFILDELRKVRDTFARKYHYDLHELIRSLSQTEKTRGKKEKPLKRTSMLKYNLSRREKIRNTLW